MVRERCRGESEECDEERIEVRHTQGTCVSLRTASTLKVRTPITTHPQTSLIQLIHHQYTFTQPKYAIDISGESTRCCVYYHTTTSHAPIILLMEVIREKVYTTKEVKYIATLSPLSLLLKILNSKMSSS